MKHIDTKRLIDGVLQRDAIALGRVITFIESRNTKYKNIALEVLEACKNSAKDTVTVGITGAPGVGKSTLIECYGLSLISAGNSVAVLSIDPSSSISGGSILGDKTRMATLSKHHNAFIRPSPAGQELGGIAAGTYDTIRLLEYAGFNYIIIETVGVGQSEISISEMVDAIVLVINPVSGDALQGIKRGIMEIADILFVNKADGDLKIQADLTSKVLKQALHIQLPKETFWSVPVLSGSALKNEGVNTLKDKLNNYLNQSKACGNFTEKRNRQKESYLNKTLLRTVHHQLATQPSFSKIIKQSRNSFIEENRSLLSTMRTFESELIKILSKQ